MWKQNERKENNTPAAFGFFIVEREKRKTQHLNKALSHKRDKNESFKNRNKKILVEFNMYHFLPFHFGSFMKSKFFEHINS